MNLNLVSNIFNYLEINEAEKYLDGIKNENDINYIIRSFACLNNVSYKNMKAKFNNLKSRCGYCNNDLVGDYVLKMGFVDCNECGENKNYNIHLCHNCSNLNLKRGQFDYKICMNKHKTICYGINCLS